MFNVISKEQMKNWESLVDVNNSGEDVQALDCFFVNKYGESCYEEEAVGVCFNAYDYDNRHDFDILRSTLREVNVQINSDCETEIGDFDGCLETRDGHSKTCYGRMYSVILSLIK